MVAQSLDLPPRAAKWRHRQRQQAVATGARPRAQEETALLPGNADDNGAGNDGGFTSAPANRSVDVRSRVAGMLEKERDF